MNPSLTGFCAGGGAVQTDQVLYNLSRRGIEYDLMPWQQQRGIPIMAYSPIEQGRLADNRALARIADGTYGVCESCGKPIGKRRLMAFPRATMCMECKQREERR